MSKLYWLVLSRKQNNISAASPFHFAFFQSPSHLTVWKLPGKCCSALTRHGIEEDNLLGFSPVLQPALVSCLNNTRLKLTTRL